MQNPEILGGAVLVFPERLSLGIFLTGVLFSPFILYYGISGGVFFLRRKEWDLLRGFNERLVAFEDIDFALRLKRLAKSKGKKFKILWSSYIITSCRKFDKLGDYYYLNPLRLWRLYKQDREEANKLWYHFHDTQKR
ncbi:MAG: glycosyl transferase family 2 [Candidatus Dadabacteria bacterium]|nr:MAG: glycosyl transferase family 2 [Candidatus Dadabacteria bacterium]